MSNQSEVLAPPGMNTTTPFLNTILNTSTSTVLPYDDLHTIAAQDITSRANYIYSFLAALGFVAGCFLFYSFIQTYRALKRLAWLNRLLWAFCGLQLLLLLLSLHVVVYIPHYLRTTGLGCAALSFTINTVSLCSLFVLVLMAYVLTLDPPSHALLRKPWVCGALVSLTSFLIALMLAGLRGPREGMQVEYMCVMDPVSAGVSYAAARLCLAFLIPYLLQLGLLMAGCVRQWKSRRRFLSGSEEGPVFLTVTVVMFFCQLFYSVVLVRGAQLAQKEGLSKQLCSSLVRGAQLAQEGLSCHEQAFLTVAEFVLFSGSSASLLIVLLMHRPCRESLHGALRQLRDCCRSPGASQTNRNIIAPHIEITDTLQDIE